MTNYEKIKEMTKEEFIKFISDIAEEDIFEESNQIGLWFSNTYCKKCPEIEIILSDGKKESWKECYFESKCPHQDWEAKTLIKMWLDGECVE